MGRKLGTTPDVLLVHAVFYQPFHLDGNGLVHFVADHYPRELPFHSLFFHNRYFLSL
jgi:hypothetical protein